MRALQQSTLSSWSLTYTVPGKEGSRSLPVVPQLRTTETTDLRVMIKVCVIEWLCTYTGILENTATREGYEAHGPFIYSTNIC